MIVRGRRRGAALFAFPLLLIPFAVYNVIVFVTPWVNLAAPVTHVTMVSGVDWTLSVGELIIAIALLLLFGEMLKATRIAMRTVFYHVLSLILFLIMLVEFLLVGQAATGTFFLLMVVAFVDVIGGFAVTLRSAQRDFTVEGIDNTIS